MRSMVEGRNHARGGSVRLGATGYRIHSSRHRSRWLGGTREVGEQDSWRQPSPPPQYLDSREAIAAYIDAALEDATQPSSSIRSVSWLARSA